MLESLRKTFARRNTGPIFSAKPILEQAARCTVESLESRRLLSTWSPQDTQIGLDQEVANYPSINGSGEAIVVIDEGGVDYNHYALGNGYGNKVIYGWDYDTNSWDVMPYDNNSHATGVAGEAAGDQHTVNGLLYQGVAPGAKIIALRATGTWNVKQAFDWVVANRTKYNIVGVNYTDQSGAVDGSQLYGDMTSLTNSGVFIAGPAGNYGPSTAYASYDNEYYEVGSSDSNNTISSFTPRGSAIALVAPADNIDIDWYWNGQAMDYPSQGTSWAAPQAVGLAALIKQVNPGFSTQQIFQIMQQSSTSIWDSYSNMNYDQINVNAAVALAYKLSGSTPTTSSGGSSGGLQSGSGGSSTTSATGSSPFTGTPYSVGSVINFANYDTGGEGVAYHAPSGWNEGNQTNYRTGNVSLGWSNSQNNVYVGWTTSGEWMNYTVNAASAGTYNLALQAGASGTGGTFHIEVDGKNVSGELTVPNTGSWDAYQTVNVSNISLTAGNHVVRIVMDGNGQYGFTGNFTTFQFSSSAGGVASSSGGSGGTYTPNTWTVPNGPFDFWASNATKSSLTLNFYDTANNESTYVIQRATSPGGPYTVVGTVDVDQPTSQGTGWRSWTDWNCSAGTTYYYLVTANNQYGASSATGGSGTTTWS